MEHTLWPITSEHSTAAAELRLSPHVWSSKTEAYAYIMEAWRVYVVLERSWGLTDAVLQGGPCQAELVLGFQSKHSLGGGAVAVLDAVCLIQDNAAPPHLQTQSMRTTSVH